MHDLNRDGTPAQLRVCWTGPLPRPGTVLDGRAAGTAYVVRSYVVLHTLDNSPKPRLLLHVTKHREAIPANGAIHLPWSVTTPPPQPSAVKPPRRHKRPPVATTPEARSATARARRLAAEAASPPKADLSVWDDPDDRVNTRTPKQVRGHRRGDILGRMHRKNSDVTRDHVEAAHAFRVEYDIARIGLSSGDALAERVGGNAGPSSGPTARATVRASKQRSVSAALACVGEEAVPLLLWVLIANRDVPSWCGFCQGESRKRPAVIQELNKLLATLSRLVIFYGIDGTRDRLNAMHNAGSG